MPTDRSYLFTSESVSEGHPDKLADRISDTVRHICRGSVATARVTRKTAAQQGGSHA
jgi:S-adenosylmethionine synthetase